MFLIAWQVNTEQDGTLLRQKYKDAAIINTFILEAEGKFPCHADSYIRLEDGKCCLTEI